MQETLQRIIDSNTEEVIASVSKQLGSRKEDLSFMKVPTAIQEYPGYIRALTECREGVKAIDISYDKAKVEQQLIAYYDKASNERIAQECKVNEYYEGKIAELETSIIDEARAHNNAMQAQLDADNQIYVDLEGKRQQLAVYQDDVLDLCAEYGILTSDIQISNSSFTLAELGDIYDQYISYMENHGKSVNVVKRVREAIQDNPVVEAVILLGLLIAGFTPILNILVIAMCAYIFIGQKRIAEYIESYTVLAGLIFNVQPMSMGFKQSVDSDLLEEESVDEDENAEVQKIADEWEQALNSLDSTDISAERDDVLNEFNNSQEYVVARWEDKCKYVIEARDAFIGELDQKIVENEETLERLKAEHKMLGDTISMSPVFNTKFRLGLVEGLYEEEYDYGLTNIVIKPSNDKSRQRQFLQVLLANALCNVKAGSLTVYIYDPNNFGQDLVGFYNDDLLKVIKFENDDLVKTIKELSEFAQENLKSMQGMDINTFNEQSMLVGKTTREYKLLIVLSQPKKLEEDEALSSFMSYSARLGVFIWAVTTKEIQGTKVFRSEFEDIEHPYIVDEYKFPAKVGRTLADAILEAKPTGLPWKTFTSVAIPDSMIWSMVTDQYIDLDPGFWDGDPTQYKGYTVGNNGDVHGVIVGGTGAGKSVFINQLIANVTRKYSPRDLELWLIDFKGSEFSFYLPTVEHPKVLPHLKACLCTSDGDYSGSLFTAIRAEAEKRYKYLTKAGFKNLMEYNKAVRKGSLYEYEYDGEIQYTMEQGKAAGKPKMRKLTIEDDVMSRILLICDEFQVIFEKAEDNIKQQIMKDITYLGKVARACGVHVIFASQSMKGTVKEDTLQQFTLRFALRCDKEVSQQIMNTSYASDIKEQFGYLYVRSSGDSSLQAQKKYRTPYLTDEELREHVNDMADRATEGSYKKRDLITYEETKEHKVDEIRQWYEKLGSKAMEGLILLGPRMAYSENKAPENIVLGAKNNTHILACFNEESDLISFYKSLKANLDCSRVHVQQFVNCQIEDLHYVCGIDEDVSSELLEFSRPSTDIATVYNTAQQLYNMRLANKKTDDPVYFILFGWEKASGFIIEKDMILISKIATLLQMCGEYNIHFVFICQHAKGFPPAILSAIGYGICGKAVPDDAYAVIDSKVPSKPKEGLEKGYMFVKKGNDIKACKIYKSKIDREAQVNELRL